MRSRIGNPYSERHGGEVIHHDFVAHWRTDPNQLPDIIQRAVPALRLAVRPEDKEESAYFGGGPAVNGWISTHRNLDGLHVDIGLYTFACEVTGCRAGHQFWVPCDDLTCGLPHDWTERGACHRKAIRFYEAPPVAPECLDAIVSAIGEHPAMKLGRSPERDRKILLAFGMGHRDHDGCRDCRAMTSPPLRDLDRPLIREAARELELVGAGR